MGFVGFPDYQPRAASDGTKLVCACCLTEVLACSDCGAPRRPGDWPQCPHIPGNFGEEPIEPYFDEHITTEGAWITTRGQRQAIMRANNLEYRKKRTDLLPGTTRYFDMSR
jgi:hypothetical protein